MSLGGSFDLWDGVVHLSAASLTSESSDSSSMALTSEFLCIPLTISPASSSPFLSTSMSWKAAMTRSRRAAAAFSASALCLTSLDVSCNGLGQTAAERLTQVLSVNLVLIHLNLDYNPNLGNTEVRNIANAIKTYEPSIESLNFSENGVGNDVAGAFGRFLGLPGCLVKKLTLAHNCLRSTGVGRIATSLKSNTNLTHLDLARNPMGSKGCSHLAAALSENSTLLTLLLDCCGIDSAGASALGDMLGVNSTLQVLDVSDNSLLSSGLASMSHGLYINSGLVRLNLTNTGLGVKSSTPLSTVVGSNRSLTSVNLSHNQLRSAGASALASTLSQNLNQTSLDLSFNSIDLPGVSSLQDALASTASDKSHPLDLKLLGNSVPNGPETQAVLQPGLARSKVRWNADSMDALDVPMWSKPSGFVQDSAVVDPATSAAAMPDNKAMHRRPSFTAAAPDAFDLDLGASKFPLTGHLASVRPATFGVITDVAEDVAQRRWRGVMEGAGNDVGKVEAGEGNAWNRAAKKL